MHILSSKEIQKIIKEWEKLQKKLNIMKHNNLHIYIYIWREFIYIYVHIYLKRIEPKGKKRETKEQK
jgi:hypothetical protein